MPSHFEDFVIHPWETNVEDHLQHINDKLHRMLQRHCHRPQRGPERPYVDEQSWKLRKAKLHHRSELKHIRHLLRRESLARVLAAWKNKQAWDGSASFNFGSTLLSGVLKHGLGFRVKARALREHIRSNKKTALHHIVKEFNHTTAAIGDTATPETVHGTIQQVKAGNGSTTIDQRCGWHPLRISAGGLGQMDQLF